MLVVAAFRNAQAGARALRILRRHFSAELHTRERVEIESEEEIADQSGDFIERAAVAGAIAGAAISMLVQWWSSSIAYPLVVGGRTPPEFFTYVPAALAVGMFWSALAAFIAFLWSCGLPRLHHPLFDAAAHADIAKGGSVVTLEVEQDDVEAACALARRCGARSAEVIPG